MVKAAKRKKTLLVVLAQAVAGRFKGKAARKQSSRRRPQNARYPDVSPKLLALRPYDKHCDQRAESHGNRRQNDNYGENR